MSLDPKTLKVGDVVVFGGKVEKTVTHYSRWPDGGCIAFGVYKTYEDDPIWRIAELKCPELPKEVGKQGIHSPLFTLNSQGNYDPSQALNGKYYYNYPPHILLTGLKRAVSDLKEAGVK